jgi:competence ComEA-like helix-hairpin-helix protein
MKHHFSRTAALLLLVTAVLALPAQGAEASGSVNINTASAEQLMLLPRIGPSVARRIIEFRDQNGKFKQVADLMLVQGIGEKTFGLIEPYAAVTGETSLKEKVQVERDGGSGGQGA